MKIFISHSSKDKWAARRISQDIQNLDHEVFIDEKDIKTGESIDGAIKEHLAESDHFLIILSPASIESEWVLLELGGAMALNKKIIPILMYVGANEIPQAISLKLARDINDVEKYYDEIRKTPKKKIARKKIVKKKASVKQQFKAGDKIKVISSEPTDAFRDSGLDIYWVEEMNSFLGQKGKIDRMDEPGIYMLDLDDNKFGWAAEWIIHDRS